MVKMAPKTDPHTPEASEVSSGPKGALKGEEKAWPKMVKRGQKSPKMVQHGQNRPEMAPNVLKERADMAKMGVKKQPKMVKVSRTDPRASVPKGGAAESGGPDVSRFFFRCTTHCLLGHSNIQMPPTTKRGPEKVKSKAKNGQNGPYMAEKGEKKAANGQNGLKWTPTHPRHANRPERGPKNGQKWSNMVKIGHNG